MKPNSVVLKSLAAVCWKLAAAALYRSFADLAVALHSDWRALTARYASAGYTVELNRQMEAEALDFAQRMIALAEKCLGIQATPRSITARNMNRKVTERELDVRWLVSRDLIRLARTLAL